MNLDLLNKARGKKKADLVLKNGKAVDVFNEQIKKLDVAIANGVIIGIGSYKGQEEIDLQGKVLAPGFIDGHLHLESAMTKVRDFAQQVISLGTTTVVADPHEIANVMGLEGIRYLLEAGLSLPWNFNLLLPSCVPATKFDTSGAILKSEDLEELITANGVFGLGEVMNFTGVINGEKSLWEKLNLFKDYFIDGHAPGLTAKDLNAYLLGGIKADHECTTSQEAIEKISKGMYIMIREGSVTRDLKRLLPAVNEQNSNRFLFATDDRHPRDLVKEGHINFLIKKAIKNGLNPLQAIKFATINSATALGLENTGAIAPGYKADLVVIDGLKELKVKQVFKDGKLVAEDGKFILDSKEEHQISEIKKQKIYNSINIGKIEKSDFILPVSNKYRVMELIKDQIITKQSTVKLTSQQISSKQLIEKNLVKLAVVERHQKTGNVALGLLKGLGLQTGAIATSIAHDSHNIIVAGLDAKDMLLAVKEIEKIQGGIVITNKGQVVEQLALPIAGLMSDKPLLKVAEKITSLRKVAHSLGVTYQEPFMTLSFMSLPVIPELKITDKGLFSVEEFQFVPLVVE
ncbi:adenine deaminase [Halobacteroides halobius DSM 5150]|uniref:Adenine deaminase n=1 Tax=Halobacteroides halobius (strain ATCC 35273 / DSM 5150 / MD-1) TaxID=748449 RepID=L0K9H5_HALHC|nr:adenine deaminase [Halobacteroides halobius]AGB41014.1 adenine deaminase [Halobacteroides halobius DSM 5150]